MPIKPLKKPAKLNNNRFGDLKTYANAFIANNFDRLSCQKNESGFIRINIPMVKTIKSEFSGVQKLRLNYWSPEADISIQPESIHTHPSYFESFIVKGGYTHEIYELGGKGAKDYDLYRILKNGGDKSFVFIGQSKLNFLKTESKEKDDIVVFDKALIHRVLHNKPKTLTLNVIFDGTEHENYYDVYLTKNGTLEDIKTTREIIPNKKSKLFLKEIISALS